MVQCLLAPYCFFPATSSLHGVAYALLTIFVRRFEAARCMENIRKAESELGGVFEPADTTVRELS